MKHVLVLFVLGFVIPLALGQDIQHAPTADQCRADIAVWTAETREIISSIPIDRLLKRNTELKECAIVFTALHESAGWNWSRTLRIVYQEYALHILSFKIELYETQVKP